MINDAVNDEDELHSMKVIYKSAKIIRKCITQFPNNMNHIHAIPPVASTIHDVTGELYTLLRWMS
jgi:hypothetical protein